MCVASLPPIEYSGERRMARIAASTESFVRAFGLAFIYVSRLRTMPLMTIAFVRRLIWSQLKPTYLDVL